MFHWSAHRANSTRACRTMCRPRHCKRRNISYEKATKPAGHQGSTPKASPTVQRSSTTSKSSAKKGASIMTATQEVLLNIARKIVEEDKRRGEGTAHDEPQSGLGEPPLDCPP